MLVWLELDHYECSTRKRLNRLIVIKIIVLAWITSTALLGLLFYFGQETDHVPESGVLIS